MALYDTTRPYDLKLKGENEQFVIEIPRDFYQQIISRPDKLTAIKRGKECEDIQQCKDFLMFGYSSVQESNSSH